MMTKKILNKMSIQFQISTETPEASNTMEQLLKDFLGQRKGHMVCN